MNIRYLLNRATGGALSRRPGLCPGAHEILGYLEHTLEESRRPGIETHLAGCDDCRELLALSAGATPEPSAGDPVSELEIQQQTARVLAYIERDQSTRKRAAAASDVPGQAAAMTIQSYFSFPKLASAVLVIGAVAIGFVLWSGQNGLRNHEQALAALDTAMRGERRNQALIAGNIAYSPYSPQRGEADRDDLRYEFALSKVSFAEAESAPAEDRLALARIRLALGGRDEARKARVILEQVESAGVQSPELFNDRGVAELQLGNYDAAIEYFRRALDQAPGNSRFLFNKALAQQKAGRVDEAREDWDQFIRTSPEEQLKAEARAQLDLLR